jgi:hypothetical protein
LRRPASVLRDLMHRTLAKTIDIALQTDATVEAERFDLP